MTDKTITIDAIMALRPCAAYSRDRVVELFDGRESLAAREVGDLDIPWRDRLWVLIRWPGIGKSHRVRHAIGSARQVLPVWEAEYPDDARPRLAIEAAERWLADPTKKNRQAAIEAAAAATAAYAAAGAADAADAADAIERMVAIINERHYLPQEATHD